MRNVTLLADDVIYESWHSLVPVVVALVKVRILNNTQFQTHTQKIDKICFRACVHTLSSSWGYQIMANLWDWILSWMGPCTSLPRAEVL